MSRRDGIQCKRQEGFKCYLWPVTGDIHEGHKAFDSVW